MNKTRIDQPPVCRTTASRLLPACLFAGWCLLVASSCTLHEVEEGRDVIGNGEKIEMAFSLSVSPESAPRTRSFAFAATGSLETESLAAAGTINATRAGGLTAVQEKTLTNLCVAQYNEKGVQTSNPVYYDTPALTANATGDTLTLSLMLDDNNGKNTVYLLGNVGNKAASLAGKTEAELKALTVATSSVFTADGMPQTDQCILVGTWTGYLSAPIKEVPLTRAVAKISFSYEVAAGEVGFAFEATGLKLGHVPAQLPYIEPKDQLQKIEYTEYVTTNLAPTSSAPCCWYLPENLAGTVTNDSAVYSEKEKVGAGVSNATYIELTGNVTQSSVSYPGVVFKLYPGSLGTAKEGCNDYNVARNSHHVIHVKLAGIDFSDKRFTVGKLGPITTPDTLASGIGETTAPLQIIPVQPGTTWSFLLPAWLSACITYSEGGQTTTVPPLQNVSYHGAASVEFTTTTVNPNATPRDYTFKIADAVVTLTQDTALFWVYPQQLTLANTDAEESITIHVAKDLPWTVRKAGGSDSINTASETTRYIGTQTIAFKAIKNDTDIRSASFTLATAGSFPARELVLTVHQDRKPLPLVMIDKSVLADYIKVQNTTYPPFIHDGGKDGPNSLGADLHREEVENGEGYMIWVQSEQNPAVMACTGNTHMSNPTPDNATAYCAALREGGATNWRLPTPIELFAVVTARDKLVETGVAAFPSDPIIWSAGMQINNLGIVNTERRIRSSLSYNGNIFMSTDYAYDRWNVRVRCVRDY